MEQTLTILALNKAIGSGGAPESAIKLFPTHPRPFQLHRILERKGVDFFWVAILTVS